MSLAPSSSRGGGTGNTVLTGTTDATPVLRVVAAAGTVASGNAILVVTDENGDDEFYLDPDFLAFRASTGAGAAQVVVAQRDAGSGSVVLDSGLGLIVDRGHIRLDDADLSPNGIGLIVGGPHAAPADGTIQAGEWTLWLDQTPGVGNTKLMVKAKDSGGTVKTATILLA